MKKCGSLFYDKAVKHNDDTLKAYRHDTLLWQILMEHKGHRVEIVWYGDENDPDSFVGLKDMDTNRIILDADIYTLCVREGCIENIYKREKNNMKGTKTFRVYQIKKDAQDIHYKIFEPYNRLIKHFGNVDFNDYQCVYKGLCKKESTLDDIYKMCNLKHPIGYEGHSLSVSDIVHIDGKYYYCDSVGWKELNMRHD